jgi:hypothetical protein
MIFTTSGRVYSLLIEKRAKQPWIIGWNFHDGFPFHTHIGTNKTCIQSNKVKQDHVILDEK